MRTIVLGVLVTALVLLARSSSTWLQVSAAIVVGLALLALLAQQHRLATSHSAKRAQGQPTGELASPAQEVRSGTAKDPDVALVMVARNSAHLVADSISSVKAQTLTDFEAVLVDNGSTDDTLAALQVATADDARFKIIHLRGPVGLPQARDVGLAASNAPFLTLLEPGDQLEHRSLEQRVRVIRRNLQAGWVAGAYCGYHRLLDGHALVDSEVQSPVSGPPISWLSPDVDHLQASTPLVRRDAILATGGFQSCEPISRSMPWTTLLRAGFVLLPTASVGVGIMQRADHSEVDSSCDSESAWVESAEKEVLRPSGVGGPFWYEAPRTVHLEQQAHLSAAATRLGIALAESRDPGCLLKRIQEAPTPLVGWEIDVVALAIAGLRNTAPGTADDPDPATERRIRAELGPIVQRARSDAGQWQSVTQQREPAARTFAHVVSDSPLVRVGADSIAAFTRSSKPVLILPSAAYHTDELIDLIPLMRERGYAPIAMLNEDRWAVTGRSLARVDVLALAAIPAGNWLHRFDAILTFNDWWDYSADFVEYVKGSATVSFAKVEGVQDWHDVDTRRTRNAYLTADVVLCQGENDQVALADRRGELEVVGSDRLEEVWREPLPPDGPPRVAANVNFTYDVLTEHRDLWVHSMLRACRRAGLPVDLSLHPSETARFPGLAADAPLRHLLTTHSVFVSRFSTAIFEAMARGCSVIYFNPHDERVPTFREPEGAFEVANSEDELCRALRRVSGTARVSAKEKSEQFFRRQVSMIDGASVASRTIAVMDRHLNSAQT